MATKRMLIDASHPEETRVVVIEDTRLEDYDVEVASRRQLKGNIYLAKVTRVEPSLQAAFVDYGGNRHGFLAFNEIHPDYYQIPVADRQALLAEHVVEEVDDEAPVHASERGDNGDNGEVDEPDDEDDEVVRRRLRPSSRRYKIQEVIKRRQILLVQVVKEERGNKGAALTTYLSLAGRYGVLMPNTVRGGGISRKITSGTDRSRLKRILADLEIPEGMAVIVRTAGEGRSKAEIKRDYEYLLRLWSSIRDETLSSMAPALVYEEGNLIKRSIRDLYGRDIEEIIIQGENEYKIAKEFMKLFIPSHAKRVKAYADLETPLFRRYSVEAQLEEMHQPLVHLKSGGSIVLNPTEALVAIDVNSGRATRERHIEETALRTNLEAADEIARQLRLRDLAGLVVVDFIDMEVSRNRSQVERRLRDAMKADRARVQLGHISQFGLMELSRQRLRPSLLETSFEICPHCCGTGVRPTTETTVLSILRKLEEEGLAHRSSRITVTLPTLVAMYLVNEKRKTLSALEAQYGLVIALTCDDSLIATDYRLDRVQITTPLTDDDHEEDPAGDGAGGQKEEAAGEDGAAADRDEAGKRGRRRKPRRRKKATDDETAVDADQDDHDTDEAEAEAEAEAETRPEEADDRQEESDDDEQAAEAARKKRRRGKRGGRRRSRKPNAADDQDAQVVIPIEEGGESVADGELIESRAESETDTDTDTDMETETVSEDAAEVVEKPKSRSRRRSPRGGGRRRAGPVSDEASNGDDEPSDQADLLETAIPDTDGTSSAGDKHDDQERESEAPVAVLTDAETELPRELPSTDERERELDFETRDHPAENQVSRFPDEAALPHNGFQRSEDENGAEDGPAENTSRRNVVEVGAGDGKGDDDSPRKGWWQRLLE